MTPTPIGLWMKISVIVYACWLRLWSWLHTYVLNHYMLASLATFIVIYSICYALFYTSYLWTGDKWIGAEAVMICDDSVVLNWDTKEMMQERFNQLMFNYESCNESRQ